MIWACVAVLVLALGLTLAGASVAGAMFVLPCMLMMGGMVWMMVRGMRGHT